MPDAHICPKCGGQMEVGFTVEMTQTTFLPTLWIEGEPERSFWTMTKIKGKKQRPVVSYRCRACGFLESYASKEWTGKFPT